VDSTRRQELIARYEEGPDVVVSVVRELSEADLDRPAPDGGWTAREIVHHLADSEMTSAIRLRRLLAEHEPTIQGYDEEAFARRLRYASRAVEPSLAAFRGARESTATLLRELGDEDFGRAGTHDESGFYSVETWLEIYGSHAHDHADQIRRAVGR
jgi:DinB superfamily